MKTLALLLLLLASIAIIGCGHKHENSHSHGDHAHTNNAQGHDHNHDDHDHHDEAEPPAGASFVPGKGVMLTDETRRNLGVETVSVTQRALPVEFGFVIQVFGENHKSTADETHHAECTAKAAGLLPLASASQLHSGAPVELRSRQDQKFGGVVLGKSQAVASGEVEILVGITNSATKLKPGNFLQATVSIPRRDPVNVVPKSAILRSAGGAFAYVQKEGAFIRTPVQTGASSQGFIEVTDGLASGETVATKPVEKLWLIELRATRGGGHSH